MPSPEERLATLEAQRDGHEARHTRERQETLDVLNKIERHMATQTSNHSSAANERTEMRTNIKNLTGWVEDIDKKTDGLVAGAKSNGTYRSTGDGGPKEFLRDNGKGIGWGGAVVTLGYVIVEIARSLTTLP